jgi:hypothetical protein
MRHVRVACFGISVDGYRAERLEANAIKADFDARIN